MKWRRAEPKDWTMGVMEGMRIDKWLWAARFFKTRALAARACELGRVEVNGRVAKAAREVHAGDVVKVRNDSGEFEGRVLLLAEMRGSATVARTMFEESEASRELRRQRAEERRAMSFEDRFGEGKPSKRDRRLIDRARGRV